MGRRGPPPTPTAILKLRNSTLVKGRQGEPQPADAAPPRPDWLDGKARAAWDKLIPLLQQMRVLAKIDGRALGRYCQLWSRWRDCEETLRDKGQTYEVFEGAGENAVLVNVKARPEVGILLRLSVLLLRLEQEFGLTPAARSRLRIEGPKDAKAQDPAAAFKARIFGGAG